MVNDMRYCRKCDEYVPDSEVNDLFHTVCHSRTVPQWSEERRKRLRAEERIKELEEKLEDWENSAKFVLGDDCPTDEVHCGCVVILKKRIKELENLLEQLVWIAKKAPTDDSEDTTIELAKQTLKG